ncbi:MAG: helix-turn-helix domain-containing protein [Bacteroidales bacterium]|jgi:excisionase family DNA binding protein
MNAISELLTTAELCEKLHICRQTVYKHARSGRLTSYRLGRLVYYKESEVMNALKKIEPVKIIKY